MQFQHCNVKTSRQTLLDKHVNKVHPKKDLSCDQCRFSRHFKNNQKPNKKAEMLETEKIKISQWLSVKKIYIDESKHGPKIRTPEKNRVLNSYLS